MDFYKRYGHSITNLREQIIISTHIMCTSRPDTQTRRARGDVEIPYCCNAGYIHTLGEINYLMEFN